MTVSCRGTMKASHLNLLKKSCFFLVRFPLGAAAICLFCLWGCGNNNIPEADNTSFHARVILPEYPFQENSSIRINTKRLDDLALSYLEAGGAAGEVPSFLFYFVPVRAFDIIGKGDATQLEELAGLLYLSGFFGGVWLTGSLASTAAVPGESFSAGPVLSPEDNLFSFLSFVVNDLNEMARSGEPGTLTNFLLNSIDPFIYLYGYNRGYLESILEHPPAGVVPPADYLACSHFLDCQTPVQGVSVLEDLLSLIESLTAAPDPDWVLMAEKVARIGPLSRDSGYRVWNRFLTVEAMSPQDYRVLLDLSAGFLLYCQVLVLSAMDAWVHGDEDMARISVAMSSGMAAWVGGYGIGLFSDYPADHLPRIEVIHLKRHQITSIASRP